MDSFTLLPLYPWWKSMRYSLDMRLVVHQSPSGRCGEKSLSFAGNRTPASQPVASFLNSNYGYWIKIYERNGTIQFHRLWSTQLYIAVRLISVSILLDFSGFHCSALTPIIVKAELWCYKLFSLDHLNKMSMRPITSEKLEILASVIFSFIRQWTFKVPECGVRIYCSLTFHLCKFSTTNGHIIFYC
jgi:hypothetical protein